jgi:molybdopterin-guanine dinucleotide biosynthesis protein A
VTRRSGCTAIVLAGGRSTRFGSEKLAVEVDGRPLVEHAIAAVSEVADEVIVAGAAPSRALPGPDARSIRSIPDAEAFGGPLAGLSGALLATTTGLAIVVGGDMPGLVPDVLRSILERLAADEELDAVLLADPGDNVGPLRTVSPGDPRRRQVLPVAIDVARASAAALQVLAAGDRSLVRLLGRLRVAEIPAAEWLALDPAGRTLLDVDRPADVARIRHELHRTPFGGAR